MDRHYQRLVLSGASLLSLSLALGSVYAAKPVDLSHQKTGILQNFMLINGMDIQEISRAVDVTQKLHVRIQEMYKGYPVFGADAVVHVPNGSHLLHAGLMELAKNNDTTMNGIFYDDLSTDLANTPAVVFTKEQAQTALQQAILANQQKMGGTPTVTNQQSNLIVYIDENNKAHWAFKVSFDASPIKAGEIPSQPIYIMDAVSFKIYEEWNDMKTTDLDNVFGGGFGGNEKMGKLVYDGLKGHLGKLAIQRDAATASCYLQNNEVKIKKCTSSDFFGQCLKSVDFTTPCAATDPDHNNVYWNGDTDAVHGGYSPSNDALFNGKVIKSLYKDWYKLNVLENKKDKTPMLLTMVVHLPMDNAYWDGKTMNFGDGVAWFYPLTSLGVAAHEVSHGFTQQHSNLLYRGKSGGMNESFSDMAAQAAEYYAYGKVSWQIGPEIVKDEATIGKALRWMDKPSKDCRGAKPGPGVRCSLDDAKQYVKGVNVHCSSGVYNRFFYTLANKKNWNPKIAFQVMVQANAHYWTANTDWERGACDVVHAAKDFGYDVKAVKQAFDVVKVNYRNC